MCGPSNQSERLRMALSGSLGRLLRQFTVQRLTMASGRPGCCRRHGVSPRGGRAAWSGETCGSGHEASSGLSLRQSSRQPRSLQPVASSHTSLVSVISRASSSSTELSSGMIAHALDGGDKFLAAEAFERRRVAHAHAGRPRPRALGAAFRRSGIESTCGYPPSAKTARNCPGCRLGSSSAASRQS